MKRTVPLQAVASVTGWTSKWCQWRPSADRRDSKVVWRCQARNVCACVLVSAPYSIFLHRSRCPCTYYANNSQFQKEIGL